MNRRVFVVVLLIAPAFCFAWGGEGHQIVALIAENHLAPQAKAAVTELLDGARISDAEVANWADEVRRRRSNTAPWHYVDIPVTADVFDRARDGKNGNNVIEAIDGQLKVLEDKSAPRAKRQEALKFIVHFVGDIHQPLHCAERNGDKGGNKRLVFFLDRRRAVNLHSVWDTWIIRDMVGKQRIADFADGLDKKITPTQRTEWAKGTPETWANESHRVAVEKVYADVAGDGPPPKLDRAYVDKKVPVVTEQLQRAGTRLAMVLNSSL